MQSDSGHTTSVWMGTTEVPSSNRLPRIARQCLRHWAGIAGMTTAYLLAPAAGLWF